MEIRDWPLPDGPETAGRSERPCSRRTFTSDSKDARTSSVRGREFFAVGASAGEERGRALGREGCARGCVCEFDRDRLDGRRGDDAVALARRNVAVEHRVVLHEYDDGRADGG